MHVASHGGHLGVVKLLLRRGVDVDMLNKTNETAADLASENDKTEVAKFIAEYKADGNIRNKVRSSTLDTAQDRADEIGTDNENVSLHTAAEEGNIDIVRLLIERGAEVDSRDDAGHTPLHEASRSGHVEVARALIDYGADINARDRYQWTPIHTSANEGHDELLELFLERGVDIHARGDEGETKHHMNYCCKEDIERWPIYSGGMAGQRKVRRDPSLKCHI